MGSYISILNNTRDTYLVKVGPDQAALQIAGISLTVFAVLATIVSAGAAVAPLAAALVANGVVDVFGISTAALATITGLASSISGIAIPSTIAGWAMSAAVFISKNLVDNGYSEIKPGETKWFGKYTLSLWQQADCQRVRVNPQNPEEVIHDRVFMRPIFSGPTDGSVQEHNIKYWVDKNGHRDQVVIRVSPSSRQAIVSAGRLRALQAPEPPKDWLKLAEEARLKAKQQQLEEAGVDGEGAGVVKMVEGSASA